jgi:bis(5'-nucleosyl)-tetraphosphatase (symmetrical)
MATYAIGDVQGCFTTFLQLLEQIEFNPARDCLWLVGDLINRGPHSLEMLRWARQHEQSIRVVLGNHDLHTIAVAEGFVLAHRHDTLQPLLHAHDGPELLTWLRGQHMAYAEGDYLMVHAGVLPQWDRAQTLALAAEVESALRGAEYRHFFSHMYGNQPDAWDAGLQGMARLRVITNALTRLRVCTVSGVMDFHFKGEVQDIPEGLIPWFEVEGRRSAETTLIFGHWSALGLVMRENVMALDTGCLWGGQLTAVRLEDRAVFQVPCASGDVIKKLWHA